jgi:hypothetical protein
MGITVAAGAITTLGAVQAMWLCQMLFFFKMAVLVTLTIVGSALFAMCLFMPLCVLLGPECDDWDIFRGQWSLACQKRVHAIVGKEETA